MTATYLATCRWDDLEESGPVILSSSSSCQVTAGNMWYVRGQLEYSHSFLWAPCSEWLLISWSAPHIHHHFIYHSFFSLSRRWLFFPWLELYTGLYPYILWLFFKTILWNIRVSLNILNNLNFGLRAHSALAPCPVSNAKRFFRYL